MPAKISINKSEKPLKIFIIAGEPSGDVLAKKLILAIKQESKRPIKFIGIGGKEMKELGLKSIFPMEELSLIGFSEIIPHIPKLLRRIKQTVTEIVDYQPDILITVDAPGFCFRVLKQLNCKTVSRKIKKVHLIAPSVWAYNQGRAQKIAKLYDLLLAILPFEPPYFEKYGLKTVFIGHPIIENYLKPDELIDFRKKYGIPEQEILLCLTPGSRISEVKRILPEMILASNILAKKYPNLTVVIPALEKTYQLIRENLQHFETKAILITEEEKLAAFQSSNVAIAKSGTNTLELSLANLPMVVTYKASTLTYWLIKIMAKVKFANLINLILNQEIIPEMIQDKCNGHDLAAAVEKLISNPKLQENQIKKSRSALKMLGLGSKFNPSTKAARAILKD